MKVLITLTLFSIILTFKGLGSLEQLPVIYIYIHVKPECLCSDEQVAIAIETREDKDYTIDVSCGDYSKVGPIILVPEFIPSINITFNHKNCNSKDKKRDNINVSNRCRHDIFSRPFFFYEYSVYNYFCDETNLK
uniref:ZP domain-containing protein n=1 Tax=Strongyloides papillosus TaxID=174720 RepID=A0A0N5CFP6_STREA